MRNLAVRTAAGNTGAARRLRLHQPGGGPGQHFDCHGLHGFNGRQKKVQATWPTRSQLWGGQPIPGLSVSPTDDYSRHRRSRRWVLMAFWLHCAWASIGFTSLSAAQVHGTGRHRCRCSPIWVTPRCRSTTMKTPLPALPPGPGHTVPRVSGAIEGDPDGHHRSARPSPDPGAHSHLARSFLATQR